MIPIEYGLSLGSNEGDRLAHLTEARRRIVQHAQIEAVACAPVYDTEPVDVPPDYRAHTFFNTVLVIRSALVPDALHTVLHAIEHDMGRRRGPDRNAPRPIDIDILYADNLRMAEPGLTIPHPRWHERRFVVQPLADVRPELVLPDQKQPMSQILAELTDPAVVRRFATTW